MTNLSGKLQHCHASYLIDIYTVQDGHKINSPVWINLLLKIINEMRPMSEVWRFELSEVNLIFELSKVSK